MHLFCNGLGLMALIKSRNTYLVIVIKKEFLYQLLVI